MITGQIVKKRRKCQEQRYLVYEAEKDLPFDYTLLVYPFVYISEVISIVVVELSS